MAFRWFSPLGASVVLFLLIGGLWILIGALTIPLHDSGGTNRTVFVSNRTDKAYFEADPDQLLRSDTALHKLRTLLLLVIAGFLLLAGMTFIAVTWFAVRQGQSWAVLTLGVAGITAEIIWAVALLPYVRAGIPLTVSDLPPFMWVPAVLILPATILGCIGAI